MSVGIKELATQLEQIGIVEDLSAMFKGIASLRIHQIRDNVLLSKNFFTALWVIYTALIAAESENLPKREAANPKTASLIITAAGGLSGTADERMIDRLLADEKTVQSDIVVIGQRGLSLLNQRKRTPVASFEVPDMAKPIDVTELVRIFSQYQNAWAYYRSYKSLTTAEILRVNLFPRDEIAAEIIAYKDEYVNLFEDYIFEPSASEIITYLEDVILHITLRHIIFESRLGEFANRFTTTTQIYERAKETHKATQMKLNRTRRQVKDNLLKEMIVQVMSQ